MQPSDKTICQSVERAIPKQCIGPGLKVTRLLGSGKYGDVLALCTEKNGVCRALKIIAMEHNTENAIKKEVAMQRKAANLGFAPAVYAVCKRDNNLFVLMDKVDTTLDKRFQKKLSVVQVKKYFSMIQDIIENKLAKNHLVHGDLHYDNIGVVDSRLVLLDFGFTRQCKKICNKEIDRLQLLRTAHPFVSGGSWNPDTGMSVYATAFSYYMKYHQRDLIAFIVAVLENDFIISLPGYNPFEMTTQDHVKEYISDLLDDMTKSQFAKKLIKTGRTFEDDTLNDFFYDILEMRLPYLRALYG
jgi:tRNA A-37 threonylcarbamoyl transferase component Bud32